MTENAFWIARFPHGSLTADVSLSLPLMKGHQRAIGFIMPGGATVGPGIGQDLGDSLRVTALTEDLKLRFDRVYKIPFFFRTEPDLRFGSRAICHVLSANRGYLLRTVESRIPPSSGDIRSKNDFRAGLVRLDSEGKVVWARTLEYSTSGAASFQVIPIDPGGFHISLPVEFKGSAGTFVAHVNDGGELKWARTFNRQNVTLLPVLEMESAEGPKVDALFVTAMELRRIPPPGIRGLVIALDRETGEILHQAALPKQFNMAAFSLLDSDGGLLLSMMGVDMMSQRFHAGVAKVSPSLKPLAGFSITDAEAIFPGRSTSMAIAI